MQRTWLDAKSTGKVTISKNSKDIHRYMYICTLRSWSGKVFMFIFNLHLTSFKWGQIANTWYIHIITCKIQFNFQSIICQNIRHYFKKSSQLIQSFVRLEFLYIVHIQPLKLSYQHYVFHLKRMSIKYECTNLLPADCINMQISGELYPNHFLTG